MTQTTHLPGILRPGQALRSWAANPPEQQLFPGVARAMPDTVDYRFRNGWTDTGALPCREALLASLPDRQIPRPTGPFNHLCHSFDGDELDFSIFCFRPTLIARGFCCHVRAQGEIAFDLRTCGGIRLWLDEKPVAQFEPFVRNSANNTQIKLSFSDKPQILTLRLEDLHERDTTNFFLMRHAGGPPLHWGLPPGLSLRTAQDSADVLNGLRLSQVSYRGGPVELVTDTPPKAPMTLQVRGLAPFARGGVQPPEKDPPVTQITLSQDQPRASLPLPDKSPGGCLELHVGDATVTRMLGCSVLPARHPLTGTLPQRKARAASLMAAQPGFEPSVALLLALQGQAPAHVARVLDATLTTIEERHDCSDFSILPLLRLWAQARDTLSPGLRDRLRAALLGYRYWLDEPGNDVMWFWSENHVLCFHTAQLVAGQLFPDEIFINSGLSGRDHQTRATQRLTRWFNAILSDGLCEWNSAAYYPIDLLGLLTLHDMAPAFRAPAARVMDRLCVMAALHTCGGTPAGSQGRCYEKELLAGPITELGSVMAILLGGDYAPGYDRAAALLCLSDYAPPPLTTYASPARDTVLEARYTQGLDHAGKLSLWKSAQAQLSSVADLPAGSKGHQAQVVDVQLAQDPMARLWINHPGEPMPWGSRRPSLLAGNHVTPRVAQDGPVALLIYDLDKPWTDLPLTQLFAPPQAFGPATRQGDWLIFADCVAVWSSQSLTADTSGQYTGALWRANAVRVGWAVALRTPKESPRDFAARLDEAKLGFDPVDLSLTARGLTSVDLRLSHATGLWRDGQPAPFAPLSPIPHISLNDGPLTPWKERDQ